MGSKTHHTKPTSTDLSYPELREWFSYLNGGYYVGGAWQSLLLAHVTHIGRTRTQSLFREIHRAQSLMFASRRDHEVLLCDVLGLDNEVAKNEGYTSWEFLGQMGQELTSLTWYLVR